MTIPPAFLLVSGSTERSLKTAYTTPANFIDFGPSVVLRSACRFHGPPDRSKQGGRHAMGGPIAHVEFQLIALTDQFRHRNLMIGPFSHQRKAAKHVDACIIGRGRYPGHELLG